MLVAMAEGMMTGSAEVAAWVSVVVVGTVRRVAARMSERMSGTERELMRLAATRAVLKLCSAPTERPPVELTPTDAEVAEMLSRTGDVHLTCEKLGLSAPAVMESIRRILW